MTPRPNPTRPNSTRPNPTHPRHPALRLLGWGSVTALLLYTVLTTSTLPGVAPVAPTRRTLEWWSATPIDEALGGVARLVVISVLGYLILVAVTQLIALATPGTRLARAADRLAPRALAVATAGLIVASGSTAAASPTPTTPVDGDRGGVTMQVLSPSDPRPGSPAGEPRTSIPMAPTTTAPADHRPPPAHTPSAPPKYVVQPGDHLWSIAERAVSLAGTTADAAVVARYWRTLIDANRDRLVDPHDPDLILPGQQLELPSLSGRGAR